MAKPSEYQSWFIEEPYLITEDKCEYFWDINRDGKFHYKYLIRDE